MFLGGSHPGITGSNKLNFTYKVHAGKRTAA